MTREPAPWYVPANPEILRTPAVVIHPARVRENIRRMIQMAGDVNRLRPHVKTHKMGRLVRMQREMGIDKFKCATVPEAEMVARDGGSDILLAFPLYGPAVDDFLRVREDHPHLRFALTVDCPEACHLLAEKVGPMRPPLDVYVDLDNGMHRTGIDPAGAPDLIRTIDGLPHLRFAGLHVYDGHIHDTDPEERADHVRADFQPVEELISVLNQEQRAPEEVVCGGTPTFPVHARASGRTLSPGTPVLWDAGYASSFPDLDFLHAAVLAGRVVSTEGNRVCLDLGHKSFASEMPHPRLRFLDLAVEGVTGHNEEHLVVKVPPGIRPEPGSVHFALPVHICPTMALHDRVYVAAGGIVTGTWAVDARHRTYDNPGCEKRLS
ncbi:MAG: D-TA family PLP-dependent enzyme [Bacteroidales bacterium]